MEVLDTAALLTWPLEMLMQGICANSQLDEVQRLSPSRHLMLESQGPRFEDPTPSALDAATKASQDTGDFTGLSPVDLDVLALAFSTGYTLVTDDYRMQNVCQHKGHPWRAASFKMVFEKFEPMHWFALDAVKFSKRGTHVQHVVHPSK